jgi:hypothetical protein
MSTAGSFDPHGQVMAISMCYISLNGRYTAAQLSVHRVILIVDTRTGQVIVKPMGLADKVRIVTVILQSDHLIRGGCREGSVQVWEAAHSHALDRMLHMARCWRLPPLTSGRIAPDGLSGGQAALQGTGITHQQHDVVLRRHFCQPLTNGVSLAQDERVIVEKEHRDHLDAVGARLELRQDHLS